MNSNWKCGVIYKYTSPSGKVYIGQTTNEVSRKNKHRGESTTLQTKFATAIRKYGFENFEYKVLYKFKLTDDLKKLKRVLDSMEIAFISFYDSVNSGYNLALGGQGSLGCKHTEEWKEEASIRMIGNKHSLGIKKTDEQKEQISNNLVGRPVSQETRMIMKEKKEKPVIQYSKSGKFIAEFKSAGEAADILHLNRRSISSCCSGTTKSSGGFIWKHKI